MCECKSLQSDSVADFSLAEINESENEAQKMTTWLTLSVPDRNINSTVAINPLCRSGSIKPLQAKSQSALTYIRLNVTKISIFFEAFGSRSCDCLDESFCSSSCSLGHL